MGVAGAGSLASVINAAIGNKTRFDAMKEFSVMRVPAMPPASGRIRRATEPEFRRKHRAKLGRKPAEEMGAC